MPKAGRSGGGKGGPKAGNLMPGSKIASSNAKDFTATPKNSTGFIKKPKAGKP
jgi:hypothetical protein